MDQEHRVSATKWADPYAENPSVLWGPVINGRYVRRDGQPVGFLSRADALAFGWKLVARASESNRKDGSS